MTLLERWIPLKIYWHLVVFQNSAWNTIMKYLDFSHASSPPLTWLQQVSVFFLKKLLYLIYTKKKFECDFHVIFLIRVLNHPRKVLKVCQLKNWYLELFQFIPLLLFFMFKCIVNNKKIMISNSLLLNSVMTHIPQTKKSMQCERRHLKK